MRLLRLIAVSACIALAAAGSAMAITGGRPDGSAHPYVGFARDGTTFCSGSLVSSTVFVTAGHCFADGSSVQVSFDPAGVTNPARLNFYGVVHVDPGFCGGCGSGVAGFASHDVAVVKFSTPIPSTVVPRLASLPSANLTAGLKVHTPVDLVGYGFQSFTNGGGQPQPATGGSRSWGTSELAQAGASAAPTLLKLASASSGAGSCEGDSGGPVLLGGTDTILAVNSFLTSSFCQGVSYAYRLDTPDELAFVRGFLR
jgi:hypothetical protein